MEDIKNLIYAYSLGCISKEEQDALITRLQEDPSLAAGELGEFQNLVALLPTILETETPPPHVKDNIARTLYKLKVKKQEKSETPPVEMPESEEKKHGEFLSTMEGDLESEPSGDYTDDENVEEEISLEDEEEQNKDFTKSSEWESSSLPHTGQSDKFKVLTQEDLTPGARERDDSKFERVNPRRKKFEYFRPGQNTQIKGREYHDPEEFEPEEEEELQLPPVENDSPDPEFARIPPDDFNDDDVIDKIIQQESGSSHNPNRIEEVPKRKKFNPLTAIAVILSILVIAGMIFAYYNITSEVKQYRDDIESLQSRVNSLISRVQGSNEIQQIIENSNAAIVNLNSSGEHSGTGKIILNLDEKRGYLQLSEMPPLSTNRSYQIWVMTAGEHISLGLIRPVEKLEYYPLDLEAINIEAGVQFIVSEEPVQGSSKPSRTILFRGEY